MKITDRIISAQDLIDAGACYWDDEVRRLVPDPMPMSRLLDLDIPDEDRVWGVLSMITSKRERVGAAAVLVREVAHLSDDPLVSECLDVCDRYARGEADDLELKEAAWSASRAAEAAIYRVARAAVWVAAEAAAEAAMAASTDAWYAARAAIWSASYAARAGRAASYAARAGRAATTAAEQRQVQLLREMLAP
jgi:hypothetical protein